MHNTGKKQRGKRAMSPFYLDPAMNISPKKEENPSTNRKAERDISQSNVSFNSPYLAPRGPLTPGRSKNKKRMSGAKFKAIVEKAINDCQTKNVRKTKRRFVFRSMLFFAFVYFPFQLGNGLEALLFCANKILNTVGNSFFWQIGIYLFIALITVSLLAGTVAIYSNSMMRWLRRKTHRSKKIFKAWKHFQRAFDFGAHFIIETNPDLSKYAPWWQVIRTEVTEHSIYNHLKHGLLNQDASDTFEDYHAQLKKELQTQKNGSDQEENLSEILATYTLTIDQDIPIHFLNAAESLSGKALSNLEAMNSIGLSDTVLVGPTKRILLAKTAESAKQQMHYIKLMTCYMQALQEDKETEFMTYLCRTDASELEKLVACYFMLLDYELLNAARSMCDNDDPQGEAFLKIVKNQMYLRIRLRVWRMVKYNLWCTRLTSGINILTKWLNPTINAIICFCSAWTFSSKMPFMVKNLFKLKIVFALFCSIAGFACSALTTALACIKRFCRFHRWLILRHYWQEFQIHSYLILCGVFAGLMTCGSGIVGFFSTKKLMMGIVNWLTISAVNTWVINGVCCLSACLIAICAFGLYLNSALKLCAKGTFTDIFKDMTSSHHIIWATLAAVGNTAIVGFELKTLIMQHIPFSLFISVTGIICIGVFFTSILCFTKELKDLYSEFSITWQNEAVPEYTPNAKKYRGQVTTALTPTGKAKQLYDEVKTAFTA